MSKSLPGIEIVGLPDAAVKEAKERIRASLRSIDIELPPRRIIINLAPSDIKKTGTQFDLPIATAILSLLRKDFFGLLSEALFFGELGLDGTVKRINGILPAVLNAMKSGYYHFFVPRENSYELEYILEITVYPLSHIREIRDYLEQGDEKMPKKGEKKKFTHLSCPSFPIDFSHIKGHIAAKRALSIAAAGFHNVLMAGTP